MNYSDSIAALESLAERPILPARETGLRRIDALLSALGRPERAFRSVHVAGSSGKGSTTTMIASILATSGRRTGLFRSPHLVSYTERIQVAGTDIPELAWEELFVQVWPVVEAMAAGAVPGYDLGRPSLFEVLFALAALYFAESGVEWAALETGMGGRLDATNTVQPDVAVLTNVSLEHTRILGSTVEQIAREKAAIIKSGCHAVTGATAPGLTIVEARAEAVKASLWRVPEELRPDGISSTIDGTCFVLHGLAALDVHLRLPGGFQAGNATLAALAALALRERGTDITDGDIQRGLAEASIPGRFEVVSHDPLVILDGAHNPHAAEVCAEAIAALLSGCPVVLLFAALADKDVTRMAAALAPHAAEVILSRAPDTPRALEPTAMLPAFLKHCDRVSVVDDPEQALAASLQCVAPDGAVVVCGSLYLVGYVRSRLTGVPA